MTITITAFAQAPDRGRAMARDMPVRWALEEAGLPYEVRRLSFPAMKEAEHLALHPFGQIPIYEDGDIVLFESGAMVLHIAGHHPGLLPHSASARAQAISWMFAALSTIEPPVLDRESALREGRGLPVLDDRVRQRLDQLSRRLGDADWLDWAFSAGDLMMVTVLRRLLSSGMLPAFPNLAAYVARGQARSAFQRAFADQLAVFTSVNAAGPALDRAGPRA